MTEALQTESAWRTQVNVVFALFQRELGTRFGVYRLGYFWAIMEPVALILVLSLIRLAFGAKDISGIPFPLFFASGILTFLFFQSSVTQCLQAVESNMALLNYKIVKPSDAVVSRLLLEFLIYSSSGGIIISGLYYFGFTFEVNSILGLLAVLACLTLFTLGICLLTAVLGPLVHESKKVVPIVLRPVFFLSGIFFTIDSLPPSVAQVLLWNPMLHVTELTREYLFIGSQSRHGSLSYLAICSLISLFLGLSVYRLNRVRLATSGQIR